MLDEKFVVVNTNEVWLKINRIDASTFFYNFDVVIAGRCFDTSSLNNDYLV